MTKNSNLGWADSFDERQRAEIEFAQVYERDFQHGTDGHNAKLIISKMARTLNRAGLEKLERLGNKSAEAWAQDAYNRYFVSAGGKNISGGDMPSWDELPEAIRQHWVAAIEGVI